MPDDFTRGVRKFFITEIFNLTPIEITYYQSKRTRALLMNKLEKYTFKERFIKMNLNGTECKTYY